MVELFILKIMSLSLTSLNSLTVLSEKTMKTNHVDSASYQILWNRYIKIRHIGDSDYIDDNHICGFVALKHIYYRTGDGLASFGKRGISNMMKILLEALEPDNNLINGVYKSEGLTVHHLHILACNLEISFLVVVKDVGFIVIGSGTFCCNSWIYADSDHYWLVDTRIESSMCTGHIKVCSEGSVTCFDESCLKDYYKPAIVDLVNSNFHNMKSIVDEESDENISYLFDFDFELGSYSDEEYDEEYDEEFY
jgi:hypothetical protein